MIRGARRAYPGRILRTYETANRRAMDPWASFALSTDGLRARYCELNHLGALLRQPSNTVSNLAYAFAGGLLWRTEAAAGRRLVVAACALCLLGLAVGSALFHASISLFAQQLDMAGAYAVLLAGSAAPLLLSRPASRDAWGLGLLFALIALFYGFDLYLQGSWLLPLLVLVAGVSATWARRRAPAAYQGPWLWRAVCAVALAGVAWVLDDRKLGCMPNSWLQWHALWHLATAFAAHQLFTFHLRGARGAR